jgi:DNA-binding NarL/FixJ family response regulator
VTNMIISPKPKPLPPEAVPRFAKCVRLLASDQPGEALAARDALMRAFSSVGWDFNDLADAIEAAFTQSECEPDWLHHMTGWLQAQTYRLSDKERMFVGKHGPTC